MRLAFEGVRCDAISVACTPYAKDVYDLVRPDSVFRVGMGIFLSCPTGPTNTTILVCLTP